jgi:hypothetical protein
MAIDGAGKIYVSDEQWITFIEELAPFLKDTEFALGPVSSDADGNLEVEYAFGSDVHPKDWTNPPWWIEKGK